jgi:DNA-binding CsgD family transcriptional regulator
MFSIRREQGRLPELAPLIRMLASGERSGGTWRPGLTVTLAELGMDDDARTELDRIADNGLSVLRESLWLASLTYLADACAAVGHEPTASILYPELSAYTGTNVAIGYGVISYGAADRYLGMLAATLGETELAARHFEAALELNRAMGADTWIAHTAYEYGRLLARDGGNGDRAGALLSEATSLAKAIGMPALLSRIDRLDAAPVVRTGLPDGLSAREAQILRLVARGLSNREIGAELVISEHTAANHIRSILRKTGCGNRTEAATYAHRHGLTD